MSKDLQDQSKPYNPAAPNDRDPWTDQQMAAATPLARILAGTIPHGSFLSTAMDAADARNVFVGFVFNNGWGAWAKVYRVDLTAATPAPVQIGAFKCSGERKADSLTLKVAGDGLLVGMSGHVSDGTAPDANEKTLDLGYLPNVVLPAQPDVALTDVHDADWWAPFVHLLIRHGVLSGYGDGTFRPGGNVTRAQFAKGVALAALRFVGFEPPAWLRLGH